MKTHVVSAAEPATAVARLAQQRAAADAPQLIFAFYGEGVDDALLHRLLAERWPQVPVVGGTSAGGVMTQDGLSGPRGIGLMAVDDPEGNFGVAAGPLGPDPEARATALLLQAMARAGCEGELPAMVWVYQAPGSEEAVLTGLRRVVGDRCPIMGGSAADDAVAGHWRQLGPEGPLPNGLSVAVLYPAGAVRVVFQGGYEPSGPTGVVTGVGGTAGRRAGQPGGPPMQGRELLTIDGRPAAAVYNGWLDGALDAQLDGGAVLAETALQPLAVKVGQTHGLSHYLLVHPSAVTPAGSLRTFCDLRVGDRLHAMRGDRARLIARAGRVAAQARASLPAGQHAAGALIVYCGGCRLAVGDELDAVMQSVRQRLGPVPFLGCFTFGEQGWLLNRNVHGNLMIAAVVLGAPEVPR